ncbi:MAG: protein-methionine-sulfoxide reductase catalytic subunit MsrP [Chloroflexota bacterium]|nr:protein-methionine-sulfoxide reductase catalytic subunit MsrP [Chloroflexota bacterium]
MTHKYRSVPVKSSEITPHSLYLSRREFLKATGLLTGSALLAACTPTVDTFPRKTDELGDPANSFEDITQYNNYYEFSENKEVVNRLSRNFRSHPWTVDVTGLVERPRKFAIEDLIRRFPQEERIYRLRCVEGWSMVIPWMGLPLASLLREVEPTSDARYVRFATLLDQEQFPHQGSHLYPWPYREGLRLDEAMHHLTILATGLYGEPLPNQNGAPLRMVVPWKYGFKSIKAIVRIELVAQQPGTFWKTVNRKQYGFYSNVNPNPTRTRWSQATERRIGELERRPTLMFNGYGEQVAHLYEGMDLIANY